jgi:hypothetical protein
MARSEGTIHDEDANARAVGLSGEIGYGMLAATLLSRAITDVVGAGNVERLYTRFVRPSWVGETLETHAVVKVLQATQRGVRADLQCRVCTIEGEDRLRGSATVMVRPGSAPTGVVAPATSNAAPPDPEMGTRVVVERSAVMNFARSADETNADYFDPVAARAKQHRHIPAPPTFGLDSTLQYWGAWSEVQGGRDVPDPMQDATDTLERLAGPGLIVQADQLFLYRRPIYVDDVLVGTSRMGQPLKKDWRNGELTFLGFSSQWSDARDGAEVMSARMTIAAPRERRTS